MKEFLEKGNIKNSVNFPNVILDDEGERISVIHKADLNTNDILYLERKTSGTAVVTVNGEFEVKEKLMELLKLNIVEKEPKNKRLKAKKERKGKA